MKQLSVPRHPVTRVLAALAVWLLLPTAAAFAADDLRLLDAVRRQDNAAARALLKQRADVNVKQADGATALHWAVHWEDLETTDLLIRAGARVDAANDLGVTPILMASASGNGPIVQRLLAAGASARAALESGETALMLATRAGTAAAVAALLDRGADVNAREGTRGQTALMWAVANKHSDITRLLISRGADVRARSQVRRRAYIMGGNRSAGSASRDTPIAEIDEGGSTPLLFAARSGDLDSARLLIAAGASASDTAADGNTALVIAAHSGHGSLAALLLDHGADPNAAPLGYTALHAAVLRGTLSDRGVRNPDPGAGVALVRALLAKGANPNAQLARGTPVRRWSQDFAFLERWVGATPFWLAAKFLEIDMMRALRAAGADPLLRSRDGTTPLMVAAGNGYSRGTGTEAFIRDRRDFSSYNGDPLEIATRIPVEEERLALQAIELAIELGNDVNAANQAGDTALHAAAAIGMDTVIELLARRGANVNARNKAGRTPLSVARREDGVGASVVRESTAALLRKLGAKE
jgi:ankyrin repeat protein